MPGNSARSRQRPHGRCQPRRTAGGAFFRKKEGDISKIDVRKPDKEDLEKRGVSQWPIWQKEVYRFGWHYDVTEECYLLEGKVAVEAGDGESVEFGKGDFVTFPRGLSCVWEVKEPVKKHYNFR